MKVHHLNCATLCPLGGRLVNGDGGVFERGTMICHCLLIETPDGLVLVDSGFGLDDVRNPGKRLGRELLPLLGPRFDEEETAIRQVEKLGFKADDVRNVVVTHLDLDHAGGIPDFPKARIHTFAKEHQAAMARATFFETRRYRPMHWAHDPTWVLHRVSGERWFHFEAVHALGGKSSADVLLVPLVGHTRGHCGVAVRTHDGWMLHCGDAYFYYGEMDPVSPRCTPLLDGFQKIIAVDGSERLRNQERLRALVRDHGSEVQVFCAHDPKELERMRQAKGRAKAA